MKKLVWMVPAMAGLVMVAGCNTTRRQPEVQTQRHVTPEQGTWEVTTEMPGFEQRVFVPASQLPVPAVAQTTPYVVAKGDTLSAIAARFNLRWQDIAAVNPGLEPNKLRPNQTIYLPGVVDVNRARAVQPRPVVAAGADRPAVTADNVYIVKRGDTLSHIAQRHGVTVAGLKAANGLTSDRINENQKLTLPAGAKKDGATVKPPAPPQPLTATPPKEAVTPPPVVVPPPVAPVTPEVVVVPPPVPPVVESVAVSEFRTHTVQPGEDIFAVALRWGVTPIDLRELNNINGNVLVPGTELKIPPPAMPAP